MLAGLILAALCAAVLGGPLGSTFAFADPAGEPGSTTSQQQCSNSDSHTR